MKKLLYVFMAALAIASCRNFEEQVQSVERVDGPEEDLQEITVTAVLPQDSTKTALASNGFGVNWNAGDKITLIYLGTDSGYYYSNLTLSSGAGTPNAVFTGSVGNFQSALGAFYPAATSSPSFLEGNVRKYPFSLASEVNQTDGNYPFAVDDIKASADFSGSPSSGLTVNFKENCTLLNFKITPTDAMVAANDKLNKLVFTSTSSNLTGDFSIEVSGSNFTLNPGYGSGIKSRTINFSGSVPAFTSGNTTDVLMMVLPGMVQNENVQITMVTDNYNITVNAKAAKNYQPGYKYTMDVNLPSLVAASKASLTIRDTFLQITDRTGVFNTSNPENPVSIYADDVQGWQSGASSSGFRLQNWTSGELITFTIPAAMTPGNVYNIGVKSLKGTIATGNLSARFLSTDGTRYWFKSEDGNTGYIFEKL